MVSNKKEAIGLALLGMAGIIGLLAWSGVFAKPSQGTGGGEQKPKISVKITEVKCL